MNVYFADDYGGSCVHLGMSYNSFNTHFMSIGSVPPNTVFIIRTP